jgi:hypothetical protein
MGHPAAGQRVAGAARRVSLPTWEWISTPTPRH